MTKIGIRANEALNDIRSGLDDEALMDKYGLSVKGLYLLFRKLVSAGVLDPSEVMGRGSFVMTIDVTIFECRSCRRILFDGFETCPACGGELVRRERHDKPKGNLKRKRRKLTKKEANEFIQDLEAGVSDEVMKIKYDLDDHKFLITKAVAIDHLDGIKRRAARAKAKADPEKIYKDIKMGMDDSSLMIKYNLSARELQDALREIIRTGLATTLELSKRLSITKSQVSEAFIHSAKIGGEFDPD
jgi:hypothetical protein